MLLAAEELRQCWFGWEYREELGREEGSLYCGSLCMLLSRLLGTSHVRRGCGEAVARRPQAAFPYLSGETSSCIVIAIQHHQKSVCTIILSRKRSKASRTLEHSKHLCKIRVAMVLEVPRILMQTAEFSIKLEGISTTVTTML
jgi:hypothetical protein